MHSFGQFRRAKEKTIRVRDRVEFGLTKRSGSERCRTVERPPSGERRWNRVRSNLGSSEMASQLLRGGRERGLKGIRNKEGEREREERERTRERNGGTRGVCRGTERRNVDEDRTRYGDERGPGGQWVSGPGPLNS